MRHAISECILKVKKVTAEAAIEPKGGSSVVLFTLEVNGRLIADQVLTYAV